MLKHESYHEINFQMKDLFVICLLYDYVHFVPESGTSHFVSLSLLE